MSIKKFNIKIADAIPKVHEMLLADGWQEDGHTAGVHYRVVTTASYPFAGANVDIAGKARFIKNGWTCAVGKRRVKFYFKVDGVRFDYWIWGDEPDVRDFEAIKIAMEMASKTGVEKWEQFREYYFQTKDQIARKEAIALEGKWDAIYAKDGVDMLNIKLKFIQIVMNDIKKSLPTMAELYPDECHVQNEDDCWRCQIECLRDCPKYGYKKKVE